MFFTIFLTIFIFVFGLTVGSFLNVVICRLPRQRPSRVSAGLARDPRGSRRAGFGAKKGLVVGRSRCPHCRHLLAWYDLIPVVSFVLLKARCRYCHKKISWQYPLVELATGFLFVMVAMPVIVSVIPAQAGIHTWLNDCCMDSRPSPSRGQALRGNDIIGSRNNIIGSGYDILGIVFLWTIISFLIIIFVYDLRHYLIPDKVIFSAIGLTFLYLLIRLLLVFVGTGHALFLQSLIIPLLSGFGASLFFLFLVLITRGKGMGLGDVKLAFLMGLLLSWPNILVALMLAFLVGGLIGIVLVLFKKKTMKSMVPFGPFLVFGTLIALFYSGQIINWYWQLMI